MGGKLENGSNMKSSDTWIPGPILDEDGVRGPKDQARHSSFLDLPPGEDVRPSSGKFGLEEDIAIINDISKTQRRNMWKRMLKSKPLALNIVMISFLLFYLIMMGSLLPILGGVSRSWIKIIIIGVGSLLLLLFMLNNIQYASPFLKIHRYEKMMKTYGQRQLHKIQIIQMAASQNIPQQDPRVQMLIGANFTEQILYCCPMDRDAFPWQTYRNYLKAIAPLSLGLGLVLSIFFAMMIGFDPIIFIRGLFVIPLTIFAGLSMGPAFRHFLVVKMRPETWFWIRVSATIAVSIGIFMLLIKFLISIKSDISIMQDPFIQAMLFLPRAMADLIIIDGDIGSQLVIMVVFWVIGAFSYLSLKKLDFPKSNGLLLKMIEYFPRSPWKKETKAGPDGPTIPEEMEEKRKVKEKKKTRSQKARWKDVDKGGGVGAIRTLQALRALNLHIGKVTIGFAISFAVIFTIIYQLSGREIVSFAIMLPLTMIYLMFATILQLPNITEAARIYMIRLLPIEGKRIVWAHLRPALRFGLMPYWVSMSIAFLANGVTDPLMIAIYLVVMPVLSISFMPLGLMKIYGGGKGRNTSTAGVRVMILVLITIMDLYVYLFLTLLGIPLWAILMAISVAMLGSVPLQVGYVSTLIHKRYMDGPKWKARRRLRHILMALFIILLVLAVPFTIMVVGPSILPFGPGSDMEVDLSIDGTESISDGDYTYTGSIVVETGAHLTIENSSIFFKVRQSGLTGLYVNETSSLTLIDSTIRSDEPFRFVIEGDAIIRNSTILGPWGDDDTGGGGVSIYSGKVIIENTTIDGGNTNGLYLYDTYATVSRCNIRNNDDDGIEIRGGRPTIEGNLIEGNGDDGLIILTSSEALIRENQVLNNSGDGMDVDGSVPTIIGNLIADNDDYGLLLENRAAPDLLNNTLLNNGEGNFKIQDGPGIFDGISLIIPMFITTIFIIAFAVVLLQVRRRQMG